MGFTGDLVVARSDGPLEEIPLFAALRGPHAPEAWVDRAWLTSTGWQAVLCPENMDPEQYGDRLRAHVPHAAAGIAAWGAAAGFAAADPGLIEELLRAESVFVEETWDGVLEALGFPTP